MQPRGTLGPGADLLRWPAAELGRDRVGQACWFGPRGGVAVRSGAARMAETRSPSWGALAARLSCGRCSPGRCGAHRGRTRSAERASSRRRPPGGQWWIWAGPAGPS
ncbi:hypothetical protein NDU88_004213 [Pleurodeles waltl]|uniref:Uncharacterized protein n=1 Tax=Pleurodeles waltl TaxID=8319 RepID=A0AAV7UEV0_PLEWA|nr:hypothetical protein NDU88_004213 [Pleurodeles waltl]